MSQEQCTIRPKMSDVSGFSLKRVTGRGRCAFSNRRFSCGEIILQEDPYAYVTCSPYLEVGCTYCGVLCSNSITYTVNSDDIYKYCSESCITQDYPLHAREIHALKAITEAQIDGGSDSLRLLVRIASKKASEATQSIGLKNDDLAIFLERPVTFKCVQRLESASSHLPTVSRQDVHSVAEFLASVLRRNSLQLSTAEVEHLLYAVQCNAHYARGRDQRIVGLGLFPITSMLNHSCTPNAAHSFVIEPHKRPRIVMRAIREIEEGEEICYSYVPLYSSTQVRQAKLQSAYGFQCDCARCEVNVQFQAGSVASTMMNFARDDVIGDGETYADSEPFASSMAECLRTAVEKASSVLQQIDDCHSLSCMASSSSQVNLSPRCPAELLPAANDAFFDLLRLLKLPTLMGKLHPASMQLMLSYSNLTRLALIQLQEKISTAPYQVGKSAEPSHFVGVTAEHEAPDDGDENCDLDVVRTAWLAARFSLMALGCVVLYTGARPVEVIQLENLAVQAMKTLVVVTQSKASSDSHTTDSLEGALTDVAHKPEIVEEGGVSLIATREDLEAAVVALLGPNNSCTAPNFAENYYLADHPHVNSYFTAACRFVEMETQLPTITEGLGSCGGDEEGQASFSVSDSIRFTRNLVRISALFKFSCPFDRL